MSTPMDFGADIRDRWLLDEKLNFLNHGSFGAAPRVVLAAQSAWRERLESSPVRFMVEELPVALRAVADRLGTLLGARGDDIALVDNATTGVNTVLASLDLGPGDEVLLVNHAYPAVANAVTHYCRKVGARPVEAVLPFPLSGPEEVTAALRGALTERTKVAVLDHITSGTALVLPIAEMVALCRERGVPVCVDGAHAPGMLNLDLEALGADWYTGNCHKWLFAPKSCAFLWTHPRQQPITHPLVISLAYGEGYTREFDWVGTRDPSAWLALGAALDFVDELGLERMMAHNHDLAVWAGEYLSKAWGRVQGAPASMLGSMVAVEAPLELEATQEAAWTWMQELATQHHTEVIAHACAGRIWIRVSAQVYNCQEDYRRLAVLL